MQRNHSRITIKDIAKLSGVGKSTVSRVINGDANVKRETRELVEKVISEQKFVPSKSARAMRGYYNRSVGIIVSRLDSVSENQAVSAILPLLYQQGFDPIIVESQFDRQKVLEHLNMFVQKNIDGLIIFAFTDLDPNVIRDWQHRCVVIARPFNDFYSICYDDHGAVTQLMNYLYHRNHRQIGFIGIHELDYTTGKLRYIAYQDFCRQYQLVPNIRLGEMSYYTGYKYAAELMASNKHSLTAIVCATDAIALGVNKYIQENNISNITVGSIGQGQLLHFLFPNTITVNLGFNDVGVLAANTLLDILTHSTITHPQHMIMPSKLNTVN